MTYFSKFTILAMVVFMSSCGAPKVAITTDLQKDSVSVVIKETIIYRDSIIYIDVPVEVNKVILPDTDTSYLETSLAVSEAWVNAGKLNHTLRHIDNAKIAQTIPVPEKHTHKDSVSVIIKDIVKEVPIEVEKPLNAWQIFRMSLGTIALIALVLWAVIKIVKKYLLKL